MQQCCQVIVIAGFSVKFGAVEAISCPSSMMMGSFLLSFFIEKLAKEHQKNGTATDLPVGRNDGIGVPVALAGRARLVDGRMLADLHVPVGRVDVGRVARRPALEDGLMFADLHVPLRRRQGRLRPLVELEHLPTTTTTTTTTSISCDLSRKWQRNGTWRRRRSFSSTMRFSWTVRMSRSSISCSFGGGTGRSPVGTIIVSFSSSSRTWWNVVVWRCTSSSILRCIDLQKRTHATKKLGQSIRKRPAISQDDIFVTSGCIFHSVRSRVRERASKDVLFHLIGDRSMTLSTNSNDRFMGDCAKQAAVFHNRSKKRQRNGREIGRTWCCTRTRRACAAPRAGGGGRGTTPRAVCGARRPAGRAPSRSSCRCPEWNAATAASAAGAAPAHHQSASVQR